MTIEPTPPSATSQLALRLVPRVGQALATWRVERHEQRVASLLEETFKGLDEQHVIEAIHDKPYFADDLDRCLQTAAVTPSDEKIKLLAKVLRAELAAKDQAGVDNVQQILRVTIELDPVDIRALVAIGENPTADPGEVAREYLRVNEATAYSIRSRLVRLGLVEVNTEATIASPRDRDDDQVFVDQSWNTTPVFDALMLILPMS